MTVIELRAQLGQAAYDECRQTGQLMTAAEVAVLVKEFR
jgi:hypothetical protein